MKLKLLFFVNTVMGTCTFLTLVFVWSLFFVWSLILIGVLFFMKELFGLKWWFIMQRLVILEWLFVLAWLFILKWSFVLKWLYVLKWVFLLKLSVPLGTHKTMAFLLRTRGTVRERREVIVQVCESPISDPAAVLGNVPTVFRT